MLEALQVKLNKAGSTDDPSGWLQTIVKAREDVQEANLYKYGNGYLKAIGSYSYNDAAFATATSGFALYNPKKMTETTKGASGNYVQTRYLGAGRLEEGYNMTDSGTLSGSSNDFDQTDVVKINQHGWQL
jgi:hypothetical protein